MKKQMTMSTNENSIVFLNGSFLPESDAAIPITDRGFLFGDGIFTTLRVHMGQMQLLQQHLDRIEKNCRALSIEPPKIEKQWLEELIRQNRAFSDTWRMKILVTGGDGSSLTLKKRKSGTLLITLKPYQTSLQKSCKLAVYPDPVQSSLSHLKTLSYLERLKIREYARQRGCDDAIVCSPEGFILETAFHNLFWIVGEKTYVPDPKLHLLEGVMVSTLEERIPVKSKVEDIPSKAKIFICNAMIGFCPAELA